MTEPSTTTDPRIEAGAKAWDKYMGGRYAPNEVEELSEEVAVILAAADAVDPRKPRVIETAGELATLSRGAVLVSPFWTDAYSYIGGEGSRTKVQNVTTGAYASVSESDDFFPATVVHEFAWATK